MSNDAQIANMRRWPKYDPAPADMPERFYDLSESRQMELLAWAADQPVEMLCSWSLTSVAIAQRVTREIGWQVSNGACKAALVMCGFTARNPHTVSWKCLMGILFIIRYCVQIVDKG